jgi:hypothetical protein
LGWREKKEGREEIGEMGEGSSSLPLSLSPIPPLFSLFYSKSQILPCSATQAIIIIFKVVYHYLSKLHFNYLIQVLVDEMDEMDKDDMLIDDVYAKGDILLQLIAGQCKTTLETQLNELEEDWIDFCRNTISVKTEVEATLSQWTEYEENKEKLKEWLAEVEENHNQYGNAAADIEMLKEGLENNKVNFVYI